LRYINLSRLRLPTGWTLRAQEAAQAVVEGEDPNKYGKIWRELKNELADLSIDKCWYCETPVDRSDNAVDHFRPKNRVGDAEAFHAGYRWLAFDHNNYRYACTFCNSKRIDVEGGTSGGKADRFPLVDEAMRVYSADGNLNQERPLLLDPCLRSDCRLLGCQQENGHPCATSVDPMERSRAEISIEIYHLDLERTCKNRHRIAVQLMSSIEDGKRLYPQIEDPEKAADFEKATQRIFDIICADAPYSGEMRFLLRAQRNSEHPWIQNLLEDH